MERPHIIIVEDEVIVAEDLCQTLIHEGNHIAGCFESAEDALLQLPSLTPDFALVDIRLKGALTGIEFVRKLKERMDIPVIYITADSDDETYQLARETKPSAFLVKPFNVPTLLASIDLAYSNYSQNKTPETVRQETNQVASHTFPTIIHNSVFIRANGKHTKINLTDILFIEADGSYSRIVTPQHEFVLSSNLSDFKRKINSQQLFQVHRSYIVNLENIDSIDDFTLHIGRHKIPISKTYRASLITRLNIL